MSDTSKNPQNPMNLESVSWGAARDGRPLLLLEPDLERMIDAVQNGLPLNLPAPQLTMDDLNDLWPNGFREVRHFLIDKINGTPWDPLRHAHILQGFLQEGLKLTRQRGPLFWTTIRKNESQFIISAFERIPPSAVSIFHANLPTSRQHNFFPEFVED